MKLIKKYLGQNSGKGRPSLTARFSLLMSLLGLVALLQPGRPYMVSIVLFLIAIAFGFRSIKHIHHLKQTGTVFYKISIPMSIAGLLLSVFFIFSPPKGSYALGLGGVILLIYFMPSILALVGDHPQLRQIFNINVFFGWTIFGWFIAVAFFFIDFEDIIRQYTKPPQSFDFLRHNQQKIYTYIRNAKKPVWLSKIHADTGISKSSIAKNLQLLADSKHINAQGSGNMKMYWVEK